MLSSVIIPPPLDDNNISSFCLPAGGAKVEILFSSAASANELVRYCTTLPALKELLGRYKVEGRRQKCQNSKFKCQINDKIQISYFVICLPAGRQGFDL
jgi:hypothetical protein